MRILVTGANGFVGQHAVPLLVARGHDVVATGFGERRDLGIGAAPDSVRWHQTDLRESDAVTALVQDARPDAVLHLAGLSSVGRSWVEPEATIHANVICALHLLRAVAALPTHDAPRPVLLVGSGEAYGVDGTAESPLRENRPLRPASPYGASKAAQEMVGWAFQHEPGLRVIHARSFPHIGPGQRPPFVFADWAGQLLRIAAGMAPPVLRVGDVDIVRDISDVRDVAEAYALMLETPGCTGVYNVCSGVGHSLRAVLDALCDATGVRPAITVEPGRLRPADIRSLVGDPGLLEATVGWRRRHDLRQTITALVENLRDADD